MRNILLDLEYDGTDFWGSQIQVRGRTVQGELEKALGQLTQQKTRVLLAGRTDQGVHARGQRANFYTASTLSLTTFVRGLNALLDPDLAVLQAQEVPESFHARFDARRRTYRYTVYNVAIRSPLARRYAWHLSTALDVAAMAAALQMLLGEHDFAAFAASGPDRTGRTTVRRIEQVRCWSEGHWIYFQITANAFLRRMVRNLVGQLVLLGQGRCDEASFRTIWQGLDRSQAGPPAPPQGLCLLRVEYEDIER
ncbi:MAG: tRNA pseudouridine(38-40) synthase TruA [Chloroflexia bacterium]|nr:tRNA pseudouridine(38-40) synthase TruA [Chloroflexia bacterium]